MTTPDLWVEKYRPKTFDGYVFKNDKLKEKFKDWIENVEGKKIPIPNLLFTGTSGIGKTTIAKILINLLGIPKGDIMEINASRNNSIDDVRNTIANFCSTWPIGDYKIILLDEFDFFSQNAQGALRGEIEARQDSVRFICTANFPRKILPPILSRFQVFHFDELDMESFITRVVEILTIEEVQFDVDDLNGYIDAAYPDLRKTINLLEQNVVNKKLNPLVEKVETTSDFILEAIELFKKGKYSEGRRRICSEIKSEDFESTYRMFYERLELWGDTIAEQEKAIIVIAEGLKNHSLVMDPEINLSATIVQLSQIRGNV